MLMLVQGVGSAIIIFFTGITIWAVGPETESYLFPVATKLSVQRMTSDPVGTRIESATFVKLRNCDFQGIGWFSIRPDGRIIRVPVLPLLNSGDVGSFVSLPEGTNVVGPWLIGLELRDVVYRSFARVEHKCHPFWETVTDFYP